MLDKIYYKLHFIKLAVERGEHNFRVYVKDKLLCRVWQIQSSGWDINDYKFIVEKVGDKYYCECIVDNRFKSEIRYNKDNDEVPYYLNH